MQINDRQCSGVAVTMASTSLRSSRCDSLSRPRVGVLGDRFGPGDIDIGDGDESLRGSFTAAARSPLPCRPMPIPAMPILPLGPVVPAAAKTPEGTNEGAATPAAASKVLCLRKLRRREKKSCQVPSSVWRAPLVILALLLSRHEISSSRSRAARPTYVRLWHFVQALHAACRRSLWRTTFPCWAPVPSACSPTPGDGGNRGHSRRSSVCSYLLSAVCLPEEGSYRSNIGTSPGSRLAMVGKGIDDGQFPNLHSNTLGARSCRPQR